ncbi:hypothetical protein AVEN_45828-1 [Araneus ventricosus]|uniref:Uncharacterized protein n=1 Tax=Araneus ventricosus TaxID=182803 RepID=A0A4Y2K426_ARAVE|nr:hypothetical protein AVEN_45828-1 [Araneus ventricosus]
MSRFERTRSLFWDGPRIVEPRSDDEYDTCVCVRERDGTPSPNFRTTPTGGRSHPTHDLAHNRPNTRWTFNGIFGNLLIGVRRLRVQITLGSPIISA